MNDIKVSNDTSRNLYVKVTVAMKVVEIKGRTSVFIPVNESKDIDNITINIKE